MMETVSWADRNASQYSKERAITMIPNGAFVLQTVRTDN